MPVDPAQIQQWYLGDMLAKMKQLTGLQMNPNLEKIRDVAIESYAKNPYAMATAIRASQNARHVPDETADAFVRRVLGSKDNTDILALYLNDKESFDPVVAAGKHLMDISNLLGAQPAEITADYQERQNINEQAAKEGEKAKAAITKVTGPYNQKMSKANEDLAEFILEMRL